MLLKEKRNLMAYDHEVCNVFCICFSVSQSPLSTGFLSLTTKTSNYSIYQGTVPHDVNPNSSPKSGSGRQGGVYIEKIGYEWITVEIK